MESPVSYRYSPSPAIPERRLELGSSQRLKTPDDPQQRIDVDIPVDDHMPPVRRDNVHPTEAAWGMLYRRRRPRRLQGHASVRNDQGGHNPSHEPAPSRPSL